MLDGLRWSSLFRLELEEARHLAEEQIALAGRSSDPAYSALASGALGEVLLWIGDYAAARRCLEPLVSLGLSAIFAGQRSRIWWWAVRSSRRCC